MTGFRQAFELGLPDVERDSVVLLGAGGAGTAVAHALVQLGVQRLLVVEPDHQRAEALGRSLGELPIKVELAPVSRSGLSDALATSSGVVNASPMGMAAHPGSPVRTGCSDRTCGWPTSSTARSTRRSSKRLARPGAPCSTAPEWRSTRPQTPSS